MLNSGSFYVIGAMTGKYPHETPVEDIWIFSPKENRWRKGDKIPKSRLRGGAGLSVYQDKFYLSGGITDGHWTGTVEWFDEYDPKTGQWRTLADIPHKRDHFQTAIIDGQLYAGGGRVTSAKTKQIFSKVVRELDIYDFESGSWSTAKQQMHIGRAGNATIAVKNELWVVGGESARKGAAHNEVEIYNPQLENWRVGPALIRGRHGSGVVQIDNRLYISSGSGNQGGSPELKSTEI